MKKNHNIITLEAEFVHKTDQALLLDFGGKRHWIANSLCEYDHDDNTVQMPEWVAMEKGII